jgi:hypothetical protein
MNPREKQTSESSKKAKWVFPGTLPADECDTCNDAAPPSALCSLPAPEAADLCVRLESNGIPCERAWDTSDTNLATEQRLVIVTVAESDLATAQSIYAGNEPEITPAECELEAEMARDRIESFICPKCNKVTLENLGVSPGWATLRNWCWFLALFPVVLAVLHGISPLPLLAQIAKLVDVWIPIWIAAVVLLVWILVGVHRDKRCTQCEWCTGADPS